MTQNFGEMNFDGGIQNFGGTNTNTQHNHYDSAPRRELEALLAQVRAEFPDREFAGRQVDVITGELAHPDADSRSRVDLALDRLATNAGNTRTAAEAVAAISALVAAHWPF